MNSIYVHATPETARKRRDLAPNQQAAFNDFGKAVFARGPGPFADKDMRQPQNQEHISIPQELGML